MNKIVFKNVCKNYGDTKVVKKLNLEIKSGERLVLLGPSGCGKSTTLQNDSRTKSISSGELYFGEKLVNNIESGERKCSYGFSKLCFISSSYSMG